MKIEEGVMNVNIKFEPRDLWIGVYWDTKPCYICWGDYIQERVQLKIYLCIVPMFPVIFTFFIL